MANVVRDPREHPEAIVADFITPDSATHLHRRIKIAFVYGSKFKQRYFKKIGDDYTPFPATWDVTHRQWRPYGVTGATSGQLRWMPRSVNYDIERKTVTEWNVGCERCHGPGSDHVARPSATNIINPARLPTVAAVDVCVQCHSEGHPHGPIGGREFRGRSDSASAFISPTSGRSWTNTPSARRTRCTLPMAAPARTGCRGMTSFRA